MFTIKIDSSAYSDKTDICLIESCGNINYEFYTYNTAQEFWELSREIRNTAEDFEISCKGSIPTVEKNIENKERGSFYKLSYWDAKDKPHAVIIGNLLTVYILQDGKTIDRIIN
jgi:hypothetical protein